MKISVLLVVNRRHPPEFLRECLDKLASQSLPADEVVIVENGPIGRELEAAIDSRRAQLPVVGVPLGKNVGLRPPST